MARTPKEVIAIVLDIGLSVSEEMCDKTSSCFDSARACVSMILQHKIVNPKNKDLVSLFLLGSENTINSLDYPNIELQFPMSTLSWEMLRFLDKDVRPTRINGDWLDAIVVAMNYIKDEVDGMSVPIASKKLIVLSNFKAPVLEEQVDIIITGLKSLDIELTAIGPNLGSDSNNILKHEEDESLIFSVLKNVGGLMCSFVELRQQLQCLSMGEKKPVAWNVVMTVGPDINIPISGYKMIGNVPLPSMKELPSEDPVDAEGRENWIVKETTYMKQNAEQTFIPMTDVIKGYRFGSTIIPFSREDQESLKYNSGKKCLSILGFTKEKHIPIHLLAGDGTHLIKARGGDSNAEVALSSLINALHEEKLVGVARKIYRDNALPHLGVLIPKLHPNEVLVFIELPFSDDVRQFVFQSLKSVKPTKRQYQCIDNLIDSMDLMIAGRDVTGKPAPAFKPSETFDPFVQHFFQSVCHRALNPDSPLPPPQQYIQDSLVSPYRDNPITNKALDEVKDNFQLLQMKNKRPRKTAADTFKQEAEDVTDVKAAGIPVLPTTMAEITSTDVVQIGTVDPVADFNTLIQAGKSLSIVAKEMGEVALNLVLRSFGADDFPKALSAVQRLRMECIAKDCPELYNTYVADLKEKVLARGKRLFWDEVRCKNWGLITQDECPASNVTQDAATLFMMKADELVEDERDEDQGMDIEDLLNDM